MIKTIFSLLFFLIFSALQAQVKLVFKVQVPSGIVFEKVGIIGNIEPLDWNNPFYLEETEEKGVYSVELAFDSAQLGGMLEYSYVLQHVDGQFSHELERYAPRFCFLKQNEALPLSIWNEPDALPVEALANMPVDAIHEDLEILQDALTTLHPGLYRYLSEADAQLLFAEIKEKLNKPVGYREFYKEISGLLAKIQCGQTFANFYNQNALIKAVILDQSDKLPFTYKLAGDKMIATANASDCPFISEGTEIFTINDIPVAQVLGEVSSLVMGDGSRLENRRSQLEITGEERYAAMDVYFPLLFPPTKKRYSITGAKLGTGQRIACTLSAVRAAERNKKIAEMQPGLSLKADNQWVFERLSKEIGHLRLGTFIISDMEFDWRAFLKRTFSAIQEKNIPNLVIDIRRNEGGADEVMEELMKYLVKEKVKIENYEQKTRYQTIPERLRPFLTSLDHDIHDLGKKVKKASNGLYVVKGVKKNKKYLPTADAYKGNVYLVVGPENSSATFFLAHILKELNIATLVGSETGGNLKGINGGMYAMLHLPNSGIEVDIPLIGYFSRSKQVDSGIVPDILIERTVADLLSGKDTVIEYLKEKIK